MKRSKRGFTLLELSMVMAIAGWIFVFLLDVFSNSKSHAYAASCRGNLKSLGIEISRYRSAHGGQMPRSLKALVGKHWPLLECIETSYSHLHKASFSYAYRCLSRPQSRDIIAWDACPHIPMHSIFQWLNLPFRQVLRADGSVSKLSEEEFGPLNLIGNSERLR